MYYQKILQLIRLQQPIGFILLLIPGIVGINLGYNSLGKNVDYPAYILLLFFVGAFVMRSAGCIINDICDYKIDRQVARTKSRPLANGDISLLAAMVYLGVLLLIGLFILLQLNKIVIWVGLAAVMLIIMYPLMKRVTFFPQLFLGVTFNLSLVMGFLSITQELSMNMIIAYLAMVFWTVFYDTIYAFQDIEDDMRIGVKTTAILCKNYPKQFIIISHLIHAGLIFLLLFNLNLDYQLVRMFGFLMLVSVCYIKLWCLNLKSSSEISSAFKQQSYYGLLLILIMS